MSGILDESYPEVFKAITFASVFCLGFFKLG